MPITRENFNAFHRFNSRYKWFNVQHESSYQRRRKRLFYALYGDAGPTIMDTAEKKKEIGLDTIVGGLRNPTFSICNIIRTNLPIQIAETEADELMPGWQPASRIAIFEVKQGPRNENCDDGYRRADRKRR